MYRVSASRSASLTVTGGIAEPGVTAAGVLKCFASHSGLRVAPTVSSSGPITPPTP